MFIPFVLTRIASNTYLSNKESTMDNTENTLKVLNAVFFLLLCIGAYLLVNWAFTFVK